MYKAHWSEEKFVHITSKRFVDRAEDKINIKVYSNCNEVTLYVNGKEMESKVDDGRIFIFEDIVIHEGINVIKAISKVDDAVLEDVASFNKVSQPNTSYEAPDEGKGEAVANWFQMPDFSEVVVEKLQITDDVYSTRCSFGEIMINKEADAVLRKYLGEYDGHPMFAMTQKMTIDQISALARDIYTEKLMYMLNKELTNIKK